VGHPSTSAPTVILSDALYSRRGAICSSGISETRIREAKAAGINIPWTTVGKRKFIRGANLIWYIEELAKLETMAPAK
jgi:hypothetical protein